MKKLFSLLAVAVLGFTACQTDEGVKNATLDNEGVVNLNVSVPELATRALDGDNQSGADSAYGAIDYANYTSFLETEYDVRFQLAVYEAGAAEDAEPIYTATNYVGFGSTTNFNDLRFVPGREYQFVLFADFVKQGSQEDFRYNTADLRNITSFEDLNAMDETYDAYFFNKTFKIESGKVNELEAVLKRPFGKIRVLTTDLAFVEKYAKPAAGEVTFYNHAIYKSFNAVTGEVTTEATNAEETLRYAIDHEYYAATQYEGKEACTLFATYILGKDAQEAVNFRLDTFEADGSLIKSLDFNTEIPYQRNHLTTLVGNLLTNEADLFVRIDDNFDAEEFVKGDFENVENGLKWVREGELVGGDVYEYETNLFTFRLFGENGATLRAGTYEYTEELLYIQNATGFDVDGIDVEKGTLTVTDRGTRAENYYDVVFDIYATIDGKTENYILTWNGALKAARTPLAEPVVNYEVDEVDALYITFSWEAVENAANYTVKWNDEEQTVEGTSATFDFSGEDTYATAYVTANPANADDYTASTGSVTVDWKKPIVYTEVEVYLQYIKGTEVAFYTDGLTIYFEKYPSFEGAWYQVAGQLPVPFSPEANLVETVGSDAKVAIYEPATATCFLYKGALGTPYVLTEAEVEWTDGANTVAVAFSNEAGDAITMHTAVPLAEGRFDITPSYVAIAGDQAANIEKTEMNVLLEDGEYTIFFTIHSATNDVLMQYVGKINFEKPYAPQYVLESYTAGVETINFKGENAEFEILATSLVSGDVVVKKLILDGSDDYVATNQVIGAATAVVKEENGVYDARYTVTVNFNIVGEKTFDLQYVGTFVPYSAVEPEQVTDFDATYENVEGLAVFTGINYDYKIFVNNLTTVEYDGTQADGWGARSLKFPAGEGFYSFNHGDKLTVDGNDVTLEFVGWNGSKMRMHASTAPAVQEPNDITVELAFENGLYVSENYWIDYNQGAAVVYVQNVERPNNMIDQVTVYDDADELVFEFFDNFNNANVTATYDKFGVDAATDVDVTLTLENGIYYGLYETTVYAISVEDGIAQAQYANGDKANYIYEMSEDEQFITFKFADTVNYVNVTARYQKVTAPVAPVFDYNFDTITLNSETENGVSFRVKDNAGNYVDFVVNTADATTKSIKAAEYTFGMDYPYDSAGKFTFTKASLESGMWYKSYNQFVGGSLKVSLNDKVYTIEMSISLANDTTETARFEGIGVLTGEEQPVTPPTQDWTNLSETAELGTVAGFPAYVSDNYHIIGETWTERANDKNYGTCEVVETANGYIFTFDDEKNFRHVTITYTEKPAGFDPWTFTASLNKGSNVLTMTDGTNTVVAQLSMLSAGTFYINDNGMLNATINGEASGTIYLDGDTFKVTIDATINGVKYKGTSTNSAL